MRCIGLALFAIACGGGHARSDAPAAGDGTRGDGARAIDATAGDAGSSDGCPADSHLAVDRTACGSAIVAPPDALLTATPQPGDVVSLDGLDEGALPCAPMLVCSPDAASQMMFSDDPETVATDGVLYADTVGPGHVRVYVYHVNAGAAARKFPVVVLDQGSADAHVTITKLGIAGPSTDYVDVGKAVAASWMASTLARAVTVPAGTRVLLDAGLDGNHAQTDELVHAIVDLDVDAPVKISVVSVLATEDAAAVTAGLPLLANDGKHDRGTFAQPEVWLAGAAGDAAPSARHLRLGGDVTEADLTGTDATTGAPATLTSNYGVAYRVLVTAPGALRLAASARGGDWVGGELAGSAAFGLPTASGALSTTTDAVWLATLGSGTSDVTVMSGGGGSLPVDVVVVTP
nr:hypothetical protein [Kofleriaceae bacterium]